ncbi:uncharacterized protein SPSC_00183 [Sporisorium scitamineum]|uniref:Uncharacterized protein n=1 Tax=Sporisorium scitamineum TaxID=49012 RepID=A0A0F7RWU3_9BASI|nr:hypothetical protein [Sporisorium scitamineum]CDS82001.1 uncharacterized protein SPSC_00183 [Sporisorium scitamineum]
MNARTAMIRIAPLRALHTTAIRSAARTRDPSSASSASQPVFKKDAPPAPAPPTRPARPVRPLPPTSPSRSEVLNGGNAGENVRGGKKGSVYASYKALPYNTKLVFWACGAMFATLGLLAADKLEELFPARNNKNTSTTNHTSTATGAKFIDHDSATSGEQKEEKKPKLFSISVVDRSA